jgi:hypothetical protein
MIGAILSCHPMSCGVGLDHPSPRVRGPPGRTSCFSVEGSGPRWTEPVKGGFYPCQRGLSRCHGDQDDYVCSCGRVPMLGIDELETNI